MAYTVAQAEVTVVPDAEGFGERLRAQVERDADRIGREAGERISEQMRERVRLGLANMPDAKIGLDTTRADAQLDAFLAETKAKAAAAGDVAGKRMGNNMADETAKSFGGRSGLIMAAVGAALIAGGPLLVGAAGVLFGGLAAVIVRNNDVIQHSASTLATNVGNAYVRVGQEAVPYLAKALQDVEREAVLMATPVGEIFSNLGPAIDGVTHGVLDLTRNALPGLTAAVKLGAPVFAGLQSLLGSIGTGLSNFFSIVSQHGPAMGTTLRGLGSSLDGLLRVLGQLAAAGAELGAMVLPALGSTLKVVADVLGFIGPILPGLALGFAALKVVGLIQPLLASFAVSLQTTGASAMVAVAELTGVEAAGMAAGTGFSVAAAGATRLEAALGPIGWILAGISVVVPLVVNALGRHDKSQEQVKKSADAMTQALKASKGAIDDQVRSTAAMTAQDNNLLEWGRNWGVTGSQIVDALTGQSDAMGKVTFAAKAYAEQQRTAADVAKEKYGADSMAAISATALADASDQQYRALVRISGATTDEVGRQKELADAMAGTADTTAQNTVRLQGFANTASVANTQIGLLRAGLEQLTGKAVSMGDAEVAVTQAVVSASTALEGMTGELTDGSGALDKHTQKGAAAWQSLRALGDASNTLISTMEQQGRATDEVTKKDAELRDGFIKTARNMGLSQQAAEDLANEILGIPDQRRIEITADTAAATAAAKALADRIAEIKSKTVTVTVHGNVVGDHVAGLNGGPGGTQLKAAGGIVRAFADGGMNPMAGGIADIVGPNTWRIIGDRVTDDEAYIPINDSARSLAILAQTANRMGYGLAEAKGPQGSSKTDARQYHFAISAPSDPHAIADQIREAQMDLEFLHG